MVDGYSESDVFSDTYFALLENPSIREMGLFSCEINYRTKTFDRLVYERSRGVVFRSYDEAYRDWVVFGRRVGIEYAQGKNTVLKIVLKVKDEPELLDAWIAHHAAMVGYENLIVLDTGSSDESHLEVLRRYERSLLVLDYRKFYNDIHSAASNRGFYELISKNCRYLAVLDADEFLVSMRGDVVSSSFVVESLRFSEVDIYGGIWVFNSKPPKLLPDFKLDGEGEIQFDCDVGRLRAGAFAGKSVVKSSSLFSAGHIGHNLHVPGTVGMMTSASFGSMFVLHVSSLGKDVDRKRSLKHLRESGVNIDPNGDIEAAVRSVLNTSSDVREQKYAQRFFHEIVSSSTCFNVPSLSALERGVRVPLLRSAVDAIDFKLLLKDAASKVYK